MCDLSQLMQQAGICFFLAFPMMATAEEPPKGHVPPEVSAGIRTFLKQKTPAVQERPNEGMQCDFSWRCVEYLVHGEFKTLLLSPKSRGKSGPSANGYRLRVYWRPDAGTTRSGGGFGRFHSLRYWKYYQNFYELPDDGGYIELVWQCGPRTDNAILDGVREILSEFGPEVYSHLLPIDHWKVNAPKLQALVDDVLKKHAVDTEFQAEERLLSWHFNTMEFDIHSVDENDVVSPQPHRETGPQHDGFIIRISPSPMGPGFQTPSPQGAYGQVGRIYWKHFYQWYRGERVNPTPFRLDILYGKKTDKKLLDAIADSFDQRYRPVSRFR